MSQPYMWLNHVLVHASLAALLAAAALLVWTLFRKRGTRRRSMVASLVCFLLFVGLVAANYALIFLVQLPSMRFDPANMPGTLTARW